MKEFADQFSGSQEIRLMLVELLRAASREEEALEQLAKIAGDFESAGHGPPVIPVSGDQPEPTAPKVAPRPRPKAPGRGDLIFLDTGLDLPTAPAAAAPPGAGGRLAPAVDAPPPEGLEPTGVEFIEAPSDAAGEPVAGLEGLEQAGESELVGETVGPVEGLELDVPTEDVPFEGMALESLDELESLVETEPVEGLLDTGDDLDLALSTTDVDLAALDERATELELDVVDVEAIDVEEEAIDVEGIEVEEAQPRSSDEELDEAAGNVAAVAGLPLIDGADEIAIDPETETGGGFAGAAVDGPEEDGAALAELESRIADDPDDPGLHRDLADRLLTLGELPRAAEELRLSLEGYEAAGDWTGAAGLADRLVALEPDAIHHHQKRVELAFRTGERGPLLDAYLALGDALARAGATDKAMAVYRRVQEHDPDNDRATAAIAALSQFTPARHAAMATPAPPATRPAPPPASPPPPAETKPAAESTPASDSGSFVDLGSMILDDGAPRDTRMRIERREPQGQDEQREFAEILEQFKRGIEANLDSDDFQAHYDLGVAFKEMGLLDEAIAEFQKALRAPEGRLRTSEALGTAFFEKGQFAVSEAVLRRAVDTVDGGDEAKIGLIYWLGRALEAQGKGADAITSYERAMAVDIRFMDLGDRIQRLTAGRHE